MKTFRVTLHRAYIVEIVANNEREAMELTEFFVSTPTDSSKPKEQEQHGFRIENIELEYNEATNVDEVEES